MAVAIKKWGNSQGIRFSKEILEQSGISVNDEVNIEVSENMIIITKSHPEKINIEKLFKEYNDSFKGEEFNWGPSEGEEW